MEAIDFSNQEAGPSAQQDKAGVGNHRANT